MGFKNHIRHRGFVVEAYYENSRSVIATHRAFRTRFALGRNASVPDRKTILLWIKKPLGNWIHTEKKITWQT